MTEPADVHVTEIADDAWDVLCVDADPHESRSYLRGVAAVEASRMVLISLKAADWRASYVLSLTPLDGGRWFARTEDYGGPWLEGCDLLHAAAQARVWVDEVLQSLHVVSEVFMLSPWLVEREAVARTWSTVPEKRICTASLRQLKNLHQSLGKGRRADIARGRRDCRVDVAYLDRARAAQFGAEYVEAMDRLKASQRWRFESTYFTALVDSGANLVESRVWGEGGGASAVFLVHAARASYLFATRVGDAPGAASAALWCGMEALAERGVSDLNLGGGLTVSDDDPLLHFKRSLSAATIDLHLGARCFDRRHHEAAVARGMVRALPSGAVQV